MSRNQWGELVMDPLRERLIDEMIEEERRRDEERQALVREECAKWNALPEWMRRGPYDPKYNGFKG